MGFFNTLTSTAVSFVVGGNTGISPFLSLFLVGIVERCNSKLLNMSGFTEALLSSYAGLTFLGAATVLEFVSHCVPVVDQIIDSIMTFVVPIMSVLGTMSTFGLFTMPDFESISANNSDGSSGGERRLMMGASGALIFLQIVIVFIGIGLAISMHLLKLLVRLIGEGWLTAVLTVLEASWCITTIIVAIFIRPIALFIAALICLGFAFNIKRHLFEGKKLPVFEAQPISNHAAPLQATAQEKEDVEKGRDYKRMDELSHVNKPGDNHAQGYQAVVH